MNFNIETLPFFDKQLKRLVKKYPSLKNEYSDLIKTISENPKTGITIGSNCYKIRLGIKSKGKGASGGARVITCVKIVKSTVYLLTIYDKSEMDNITDDELAALTKQVP
jgi:hypothetical protein